MLFKDIQYFIYGRSYYILATLVLHSIMQTEEVENYSSRIGPNPHHHPKAVKQICFM